MATVKKSAATAKTATQVVELKRTDAEVSYEDIWTFVQQHAGGNLHNVVIEPLANVELDSDAPVPFGYNGKRGGVRETIQNWMLHGVEGDRRLSVVLSKAKPLGHSSKKPVCLHALLNGGYSTSSSVWGTGYVRLVVQPTAK